MVIYSSLGREWFRRRKDSKLEEVSMKWMDRPSVTEMDKGGVYEIGLEDQMINSFVF